MSRKPKKRLVGFVKMRETAELVMILFGFITMSYTYTCDLYKALMYNNHMNSNSLSVPVKGCCIFCLLSFQEQWRRWLTECQMEAGSSWCHARITLLSCWSTFHWAWFWEDCLSPGGLLSFMFFSIRRLQHSFVMISIEANMSHTRGTGKLLYHLCCE